MRKEEIGTGSLVFTEQFPHLSDDWIGFGGLPFQTLHSETPFPTIMRDTSKRERALEHEPGDLCSLSGPDTSYLCNLGNPLDH